ncbi:MAG: cupin domain-containing protein [Thermoanaerobaculia bacterium]
MERRDFLRRSTLLTGLVASGGWPASRLLATQGGAGATLEPLQRRAELANARAFPGVLLHFLLRSAETGGTFALFEGRGVPGMEPPPHTHTREDETIAVHDGRFWFRIGDVELEAGPGDVVFMPRLIEHEFKVLTDEMRVSVLISPGAFGEFFWQISHPVESLEIPPPSTAPPSPEELRRQGELLASYGLLPAGATVGDAG